jgi:hypothetical protein
LHLRVPGLGVSSPKLTTLGISLGGQPVKHRHIELMVSEMLENNVQVLHMFFLIFGIFQDVINEDHNELVWA